MNLICGLGNPGYQYKSTRHNAGFEFIEILADKLSIKFEPKFHGLYGKYGQTHLLMPQTFMNLSGCSVQSLSHYFKIKPDRILIVNDELDIPSGRIQLKFGGGFAGHNGLKSIAQSLGSQDFWRLRIGISRPGDKSETANYVLSPPPPEERGEQLKALNLVFENIDLLLSGEFIELQKLLKNHNPRRECVQ